jgi:hypothetical protein
VHLQNLGTLTLTRFGTPSHYNWTHPHATKTRQPTPTITATLTPNTQLLPCISWTCWLHHRAFTSIRRIYYQVCPPLQDLPKPSTLQSLSVTSRTHNYTTPTLLLNNITTNPQQTSTTPNHNVLLRQLRARMQGPLQLHERTMR